MIWIIGGTSEASELIKRIKNLNSYILTIATEEGKEFVSSDKLMVGRMNCTEMKDFSIVNNITLIVDLTHPYAKIVSANAKKIAKELKIKYIRYIREITDKRPGAIYLNSYEESYKYLSKVKGTVFFTTGSKNIPGFEKIKRNNRFIYRILPALESIKTCKESGVSIKDIVAILGPFSKDYNKVMFSEYKAIYVVMKDSGVKGGTVDKINACEELGVIPIIIGREKEEGISSLNEIEEIIKKEAREIEKN